MMIESDPSTSLRDHLLTSISALPSSHPLIFTLLSSTPKRTTSLFPHAHHHPKTFEREYLVTLSSSISPSSASTCSTSDRPNILVSALSAYLYTIPSTFTSILYISKLDSSGYSPLPLPLTRTLVTSFLTYHLQPTTRPTARVFVQLFARSQGQYLFANSSKSAGKRVVGGLGLCAWWKGVYEDVARQLTKLGQTDDVGLRYLLPSYSAEEAAGMLGTAKKPLPDGLDWIYAPPFSIPITTSTSLAMTIPSLPDDPKTRFLSELITESSPNELSPRKPRHVHAHAHARKGLSKRERDAAEDEDERKHAETALSRVTPNEFWERIGFRQECSSGDVTGFFTLSVGRPSHLDVSPADAASRPIVPPEPRPCRTDLSPAILDRLLTALLNVDFGNRESAIEGSAIWLRSVQAIVTDELGEEGWTGSTGTIAGKLGLETTSGTNPAPKRKEEVVTILQPRKKKR